MAADWIEYGYLGLFLGAFLAATLIPFPSEALLVSGLGLEMDPILAISVATVGNFLGGMTNYGLGYAANNERMFTRFGINTQRIHRWEKRSNRWGYWLGLIAWVPIVGDPMLVALGFLKSRFWPLCLTVLIGKLVRYVVIAMMYFAVF
ncbi:MAG: DedA family protein [bacterium]|nr:DedA family protein [bacterium]